jgi:acyloxyacyl hydrolase
MKSSTSFLSKAAPAKQTAEEEAAKDAVDVPFEFSMFEVMSFINGVQKEVKQRGRELDFFETWKYILRFIAQGPCENALNISCDISRVFDQHLPLADNDNDYRAGPAEFLANGFRGGDWRGRDCNDADATVYPGRKNTTQPASVDHNCNGIYGGNSSGSYEDMFCSGPNAPMGVAILGDSAAAHFHIPPQYLNARTFNLTGALELASNEADWPQCSWSTGFRNTSQCPDSYDIPMGSIYQRMLQQNLCMHRDLQNIGVNGARTSSMNPPGIVNALGRNQQLDQPVLVFFALIGNDVCNGHPGLGSMTTTQEFHDNVVESLQYLDTTLPKGSHVAFLGLVDGRVLWDTTNTRMHPIGVGYPAIYEYLACSSSTPCWGWLNPDEYWRNQTSERAANLTAQYSVIMSNYTFKNFDMYQLQVDWFTLIGNYTRAGYDPMNLIEPVDGFHPSQAGNQLLAQVIWDDIADNMPSWLPTLNPHNWEIAALFGDQGGY